MTLVKGHLEDVLLEALSQTKSPLDGMVSPDPPFFWFLGLRTGSQKGSVVDYHPS